MPRTRSEQSRRATTTVATGRRRFAAAGPPLGVRDHPRVPGRRGRAALAAGLRGRAAGPRAVPARRLVRARARRAVRRARLAAGRSPPIWRRKALVVFVLLTQSDSSDYFAVLLAVPVMQAAERWRPRAVWVLIAVFAVLDRRRASRGVRRAGDPLAGGDLRGRQRVLRRLRHGRQARRRGAGAQRGAGRRPAAGQPAPDRVRRAGPAAGRGARAPAAGARPARFGDADPVQHDPHRPDRRRCFCSGTPTRCRRSSTRSTTSRAAPWRR